MGLYQREADQEALLVLSGEALLVVEGQERPLRQWDFFHCPRGTEHVVVGAGEGPRVVLAVGSTSDRTKAYAGAPQAELIPYRRGGSPDSAA
jgi:quercetin dioxygenase-like cupin family protein